jgi:2',3'-cyclic-nucleotide 2'-phosphodiesterase (5'-nucleotidase family)
MNRPDRCVAATKLQRRRWVFYETIKGFQPTGPRGLIGETGASALKRISAILAILFLSWTAAVSAFGQPAEIRILHLNDFHGFAEPYRPLGSGELLGGVAYLAARAAELRNEKPSLLLAAGDMIQGTDWANLSRGESVVELMNAMSFDGMVVGNHEFDFGQEVLRRRIAQARFPVLGANVEGMEGLQPYMIREINGVGVAVIGVVTEETPVATHPRNVAGLRFSPPAEALAKYLQELRQKVEVVIVLSHIGHAADRSLAEKVKGVDLIVGGHSHTRISKPVRIGNTWIVQAWEHGKALGVIDLTLKDGRVVSAEGRLEEIRPIPGKEAPIIQALVGKYQRIAEAEMNIVLGETQVDLDGENVRSRETNLGNLVADIMRSASKAEVAIMNGGGIRMSIKKGEIRLKDLHSVLPFDNFIVVIKLSGKQIVEALEQGLSGIEEGKGRFPQISGMTLHYSPFAPKGKRVKEVQVAGVPVDPNREYTVATNDFLAAGGDGYKAFGDAIRAPADGGIRKGEKAVYNDSGRWLRDEVAEYIREKGKVAPREEGRIREVAGK